MHCLLVTAHAAVEVLKTDPSQRQLNNLECYNGLSTCLNALQQMRAASRFVELPMRALLGGIVDARIELPQGFQAVMQSFQTVEWVTNVTQNYQSQYVVDLGPVRLEDCRMDRLIADWRALAGL